MGLPSFASVAGLSKDASLTVGAHLGPPLALLPALPRGQFTLRLPN
jgi:hypothetical protein